MRGRARQRVAVYRLEVEPAIAMGLEVIADEWSDEQARVFSASDVAVELLRRAVKRRDRRRQRTATW